MGSPTESSLEQARAAIRREDWNHAADLLAQAVRADGQDAEAKALLGYAYARQGYPEQAGQLLQEAVARDPQNAGYRFHLGLARELAGDVRRAAAAYQEALSLDPGLNEARAALEALGLAPPGGWEGPPPGPNAPPSEPRPSPPGVATGTPWQATGPFGPPGPAHPMERAVPNAGVAPGSPPGAPAAPPAVGPLYAPAHLPAHRANTVLTLGILGLVGHALNLVCFPIPFGLGGGICGLIAWIMGNQDLRQMNAGLMDETGRGTVNAGRIMGMISTGLLVLGLVLVVLMALALISIPWGLEAL